MRHIGIIMAAGSGKRMGGSVPKQFLKLNKKPLLYYSLKCMEDSFIDGIVIVTRDCDITLCEFIVKKYGITKPVKVIAGGAERYLSVYEGLNIIAEEDDIFVYIHDAARPFINKEMLERAREDVLKYSASVMAVRSKDTVKIATDGDVVDHTPPRNTVYIAQTPQSFRLEIIRTAYDKLFERIKAGEKFEITDDAQVCELFTDVPVHITEGEYTNIKITTKEDLEIAKRFLK